MKTYKIPMTDEVKKQVVEALLMRAYTEFKELEHDDKARDGMRDALIKIAETLSEENGESYECR